ncbi:MAG: polysaccharide deacetylase family protein [Gammaproteobacteria bacterium]|jgi:poly-beta-1,6-N-acetyl-D-glucosamine N-deacetylase|nr:polysaccharide deacetylase family protein [Gammaproteobacteria bacterium]MCH1549998.1 polysaccharide deacetylase family protein [Pseudomonadales bacterium]
MYLKIILLIALILTHYANAEESPRSADHGVILAYHHVSAETPASTSISPTHFAAHLDYLAQNDFNVWPLDKMVRHLQQGLAVPENTVALTFDDAYASVFNQVHPELTQRRWPYTVFVNTHAIDSKLQAYMTWEQLGQLAQAGVTIGNHSHSHSHLVRPTPNETQTQWQARIILDIRTAQQRIEAETGQVPTLFAYPYGEYTQTISQWVTDLGLIGFGQHSGAVGAGSDFSALPRFPLGGPYTSLSHLATRLNARPLYIDAEPRGPIDQLRDHKTWVTLNIEPDAFAMNQLRCYASQQGLMEMQAPEQAQFITIRPQAPLHAGRNKYNCTAPHQHEPGVFFWWSYLIMQPNSDGSWYSG